MRWPAINAIRNNLEGRKLASSNKVKKFFYSTPKPLTVVLGYRATDSFFDELGPFIALPEFVAFFKCHVATRLSYWALNLYPH